MDRSRGAGRRNKRRIADRSPRGLTGREADPAVFLEPLGHDGQFPGLGERCGHRSASRTRRAVGRENRRADRLSDRGGGRGDSGARWSTAGVERGRAAIPAHLPGPCGRSPDSWLLPGRREPRVPEGTGASQFLRWDLQLLAARARNPAVAFSVSSGVGLQQPVAKPTRPSSPGGGSAGDASRPNHSASPPHRENWRSSLRFGRNTPGIPPSRASSDGPPPGELGLTDLGAHVSFTTGC